MSEPKNLSFDKIMEDVLEYVQLKGPEQTWRDFLASSAGTTVLELLSGMGSYFSFHSLAARRESFLPSAELPSSIINLASFLGYAYRRRQAPQVKIRFQCAEPSVLVPEISVGNLQGYPLVVKKEQALSLGLNDVELVVGTWVTVERVVTKEQDFTQEFIEDPLVDDGLNDLVVLQINDEFVPLTSDVEELLQPELSGPEEVVSAEDDVDDTVDEITTAFDRLSGEAVRFYAYDLPFKAVIANNRLTSENHQLTTRLPVTLTTTGVLPIPLQVGETYYVRSVNGDQVSLHPTADDAEEDLNVIDITTVGSGRHYISSVSTLPLPLNSDMIYYVVVPDVPDGTFRLTTSRAQALQDFPNIVDITAPGTGKMRIVPVPFGLTAPARKVLVRSQADGVTFIFGDGTFGRKLKVNDFMKISYLQASGTIPIIDLKVDDLELKPAGAIISILAFSRGSDAEDTEKVRRVAPGYYGARRRMITLEDHQMVFMGFSGDMVSANARKKTGECCTTQMVYLLRHNPSGTQRNATADELSRMRDYLDQYRMVSEKIEIVAPSRVAFQIKLTVLADNVPLDSLVSEMALVLKTFTDRVGETFYVGSVVDALSEMTGVKRIYLHHPQSDFDTAWNQYLWFDESYFRANLELLSEDKVIAVTDTEGGYGET